VVLNGGVLFRVGVLLSVGGLVRAGGLVRSPPECRTDVAGVDRWAVAGSAV
jgi:hypothetical protein